MPNQDFWQYIVSPLFIIPFALSAIGFLGLLLSVWTTWESNKHKAVKLRENQRRARAERRAQRRAN